MTKEKEKKKKRKVELTEKEWEVVLFSLGPTDYNDAVYEKISKQSGVFSD